MDPESQRPTDPALPKRSAASRRFTRSNTKDIVETKLISGGQMRITLSNKIVAYNPDVLSTWRVFFMVSGTVFRSKQIWFVNLTLIVIAITIACFTAFLIPGSRKLSTDRFQDISKFLKVFIAFMLGLFLNNALQRWSNITLKVTELMLSVKKMICSLNACGVSPSNRVEVRRLCILSCYLWIAEVQSVWTSEEEAADAMEEAFDRAHDRGLLKPHERQILERMPAQHGACLRATSVITLVGRRLTAIVKEHGISPPLHARLMLMANDCDDKINLSKVWSQVQMPFMYTHMLAVLVYINNILVAICCGLTLGSSIGELMQKAHKIDSNPSRGIYEATQIIMIQLMVVTFQPILYQAFLQIGATLCYPFGDHGEAWFRLPLQRYLSELEDQLDWMDTLDGREREHYARIELRKSKGDGDESSDDDGMR